jgi:hypothetical protein
VFVVAAKNSRFLVASLLGMTTALPGVAPLGMTMHSWGCADSE